MMRVLISFCIVLLAVNLSSCKKQEARPEARQPSIPNDTLISLLTDIHLAEAALQDAQGKMPDTKYYTSLYYDRVFRDHKVTRDDFRNTMDYYRDHLDELQAIYDEVVNRLSRMQGPEDKGD